MSSSRPAVRGQPRRKRPVVPAFLAPILGGLLAAVLPAPVVAVWLPVPTTLPRPASPKTLDELGPAPRRLGSGVDPRVASDVQGHPLVVWQDGATVRSWRLLPGNAAREHAFPASGGVPARPDVGASESGLGVVAWRRARAAGGSEIVAATLHPGGEVRSGPTAIAPPPDGSDQLGPEVSVRGDGSAWAVAWVERAPGAVAGEVRLRLYGPTDEPGEVRTLSAAPSAEARVRELVSLPGAWAVLWDEPGPGAAPALRAQAFDLAGTSLSSVVAVSEGATLADLTAEGDGYSAYWVDAEDAADGRYTWRRTDYSPAGGVIAEAQPFPDFVCLRAIAAAAPGTPSREIACYGAETLPAPAGVRGFQIHPPFTGGADSFAVAGCGPQGVLPCDELDMAEPAAYRGAASPFSSSWALAWEDGAGIWLHRWTFGSSGYVYFTDDHQTVEPGDAARVEVLYNALGTATVRVRTVSLGEAVPGEDFTPLDTVVRWAGNEDQFRQTVSIPTLDDGDDRGERFAVELSEPTGRPLLGGPIRQIVELRGATGPTPAECRPDDTTLCLLDGRFRVRAQITNQYNGTSGPGRTTPYSDLTGFLYLDDPRNPELAVKVLDFGGGLFQVFYAQLTDFRYQLEVTDVATGRQKTYENTPGDCGGLDTDFAGLRSPAIAGRSGPQSPTTVCPDGSLCVLGGRFAIAVDWRNQFDGSSGLGNPEALSDFSGLFTFSDPRNVELIVKLLDFGDRFLFLSGAMSNLGYTIRVTHLESGAQEVYANPPGRFCGFLDPDAF